MAVTPLFLQFIKDMRREVPKSIQAHKKGLIALFLIAVIGFCGFTVVSWKFMNSPTFCGSCHNMEPYKVSWENSKHREVGCTDCHLPPGFWNHLTHKMADGLMSGAYFITGKGPSKAHALVSSASCELCHTRDDLSSKAQDFMGVPFEHKMHLGKLRNGIIPQCTTCHEQNTIDEHISVTSEVCFQCHLYSNEIENAPWADCNICHTSPQDVIVMDGKTFNHGDYIRRGVDCLACHGQVVHGDGTVPNNKCVQCHGEPEIIKGEFSKEEIHNAHVTVTKVECFNCHGIIEHHIVETVTGEELNCGGCHPASEMHRHQQDMYLGVGGVGVEGDPFRMFTSHVDCSGCHARGGDAWLKDVSEFCPESVAPACCDCHGDGFDSMLDSWNKVLKTSMVEADEFVAKADKALGAFSGDQSVKAEAEKALGEAKMNLSFVQVGKGIHNLEYALSLIASAEAKAAEANNLVSATKLTAPAVREMECEVCHEYIADAEPVQMVDTAFPHDIHLDDEGLTCDECHTPRFNHGGTVFQNCSECHHEGGDINCVNCHKAEAGIFNGNASTIADEEPSFKIEADVACADCHAEIVSGDESNIDTAKAKCVECLVRALPRRQIDHYQPFEDTHLRSGQAYARSLVQGLYHLPRKLVYPLVYPDYVVRLAL